MSSFANRLIVPVVRETNSSGIEFQTFLYHGCPIATRQPQNNRQNRSQALFPQRVSDKGPPFAHGLFGWLGGVHGGLMLGFGVQLSTHDHNDH